MYALVVAHASRSMNRIAPEPSISGAQRAHYVLDQIAVASLACIQKLRRISRHKRSMRRNLTVQRA